MFIKHRRSQIGQTLIETMTAVFILVTGMSTAIGLGVYAFQSADDSTRVIVGTSLAREGAEAVKNQRDTNWLTDSANSLTKECTFSGGSTQENCSENWLNNLNSGTYALDFNGGGSGSSGQVFTPSANVFALKYCPATQSYISNTNGAPFCANAQTTVYSRKIVLQQSNSYNGTAYTFTDAQTGVTYPGFLSAVVTVWWTNRHCLQTNDPSTLATSCKTTLELHLTNWQKTFSTD